MRKIILLVLLLKVSSAYSQLWRDVEIEPESHKKFHLNDSSFRYNGIMFNSYVYKEDTNNYNFIFGVKSDTVFFYPQNQLFPECNYPYFPIFILGDDTTRVFFEYKSCDTNENGLKINICSYGYKTSTKDEFLFLLLIVNPKFEKISLKSLEIEKPTEIDLARIRREFYYFRVSKTSGLLDFVYVQPAFVLEYFFPWRL